MELKGRTIWLIGGSGGIGRALVPHLLNEGARVAVSSRTEAELQVVAERYASLGPVVAHAADARDEASLAAAAQAVTADLGPIDVLIYSAGVWDPVDVTQIDVAAFERTVDTNLNGLLRAIAVVLPHMITRRQGEIVGLASISGYGALPRAEAYGTTKAAANYLLQSLRIDLARLHIGVTTVNPGFVRTGLTANNDFPMPFIMPADAAARRIVRGLLRGDAEIHFPRRLSWPLKLVTALPRPAYEWLIGHTVRR